MYLTVVILLSEKETLAVRKIFLEVAGVAFQSQTSCLLLPGRLHAPRRVLRRLFQSRLTPLLFLKSVPVRLPHLGSFGNFAVRKRNFGCKKNFFGGGGSRTRVLIREIQASTGLAVYSFVGDGLAKRRAANPYSGKSYSAVSESGGRTSPDCDAEAVPQGGGTVPRDYAAKA